MLMCLRYLCLCSKEAGEGNPEHFRSTQKGLILSQKHRVTLGRLSQN